MQVSKKALKPLVKHRDRDFAQSSTRQQKMASPVKSSPRDAQVMGAILKEMGVTEYEPRVVNVMLEFVYRKIIVASV